MLVFQDLQVPFTSNLDQIFIVRKENDWDYFGLDYMTSEYYTDPSVKLIYFNMLSSRWLFDPFKMVAIDYFSYEVPLAKFGAYNICRYQDHNLQKCV